jgi:hypothetical protein
MIGRIWSHRLNNDKGTKPPDCFFCASVNTPASLHSPHQSSFGFLGSEISFMVTLFLPT